MEYFNWGPMGMREQPRQPLGVMQFVRADAFDTREEALRRIATAETLEEAQVRARVALGDLGVGALLKFSKTASGS
jgi:hypothetical protein